MNPLLKSVLQDSSVVKYLLQHENIVTENFTVPTGESPCDYIIHLCNYHTGRGNGLIDEKFTYSKSPIYSTFLNECMICNRTLKIKKAMRAKLYDDVLGTLPVCLITKYCSSCKLTYYPGFAESYETKDIWNFCLQSQILFFYRLHGYDSLVKTPNACYFHGKS